MDNDNKGNSMTWIIAAVVAVILLLAGGGYWFISQNNSTALTDSADSSATPVANQTLDSDGDTDGDQPESPALTETSPAAESTSSSATAVMEGNSQSITVDGGNFFFKPNEITVKKGVPVKITFNNTQGFHDFTLKDLDVKTNQITAGNKAEVEFTPTKAGSFEFYCSVGKHKDMGMKGTLIVE